MATRWRKVARDLRLHRGRTLLVVAAIGLGITGSGSVLNTWALLRQATSEGYLATNPPAATLSTDSIDDALLERVGRMAGIERAEARRTVRGRVRAGGEWATLVLFVPGDPERMEIGRVTPEVGDWPPPTGGLTIEHSSLALVPGALGGEAWVTLGTGEPMSVRWSGVVRDPGLAPGWMEQIVYAYATRETLAVLGGPPELNELRITAATDRMSRDHARRLAADARAILEEEGRPVYEVVVPEPGRHIHAAQMDSLFYTQVTFGLLALALSGLLVFNLITALMAGQVRQIGMMKAVGARPDQVAGLYLGLTLLLGLLAAAPSLPLAAVIGRAYAGFAAGLLNFDVAGYPIPRSLLLLQLTLAVLIPVVAAAGPVVRGSRMTVARAIRDYGIEGGSHGRGLTDRLLARAAGVTRPVLLSLRNAFRRRFRMAITLVTLAIGGAVFLGALNLRSSIRGVVASTFEPLRYDLAISFTERHPAAAIESALAVLPQVRRAEAWTSARAASVAGDGGTGEPFTVIGLPPGSGMVSYAALVGRWLHPGDSSALVVNDRLLRLDPNLALGRRVTLEVWGARREWVVVGVVSSSPMAPLAYASRDAVNAMAGRPGSADRAVAVTAHAPEASPGEVQRHLEQALKKAGLGVAEGQRVAVTRRALEEHFLMVCDLLLAMAGLIVAVGALGLATTMSLAVMERTREIGVLRAIGAANGAIYSIVLMEGLTIGFLSWALAVPISIPMTRVVTAGFGTIMFEAPLVLVPAGGAVVGWFVLVAVVSTLATIHPARTATTITTADALAYD
jgi:putative ABC transport system permease protein